MPSPVDLVMVHGRVVVQEREVVTADMGPVIERHNRIAQEMVQRAGAR